MSPYNSEGSLTTNKQTIDDLYMWDTQTEWEAYQSKESVTIANGVLELSELSYPTANLFAHWDISQQPEGNGQVIDPLIDQSGSGNDAAAVGDPVMDVDVFNGNPGAVLDGSDYWEVSMSQPQPITAYVVMNLSSTSAVQTVMRDDTTTFIMDYYKPSASWRIYGGTPLLGSGDSGANILTGVYNGASSLIAEDGAQTASGDAGSSSMSNLGIGATYGTGETPWNGEIMEVLLYSAAHGSTTRDDVELYLSNKWGVAIS